MAPVEAAGPCGTPAISGCLERPADRSSGSIELAVDAAHPPGLRWSPLRSSARHGAPRPVRSPQSSGDGGRSVGASRTSARYAGSRRPRPRSRPPSRRNSWISEVGPPVGHDPVEVLEHRLDPDTAEQPGGHVPHPVRWRHILERGHHFGKSAARLDHVEPGRKRLEPDATHVPDEPGIGRIGHSMASRLERLRQCHCRVEVADAHDAGEQDSHGLRLLQVSASPGCLRVEG